MRMVFASTVPQTLDGLMRGQLAWVARQGHEVHAVSSPGPELQRIAAREGVIVHPLPMEREISLGRDLKALLAWIRLLNRIQPDVTVVGTPKAGLLGGLAARAVRVPRRVYLMRGARFEGARGATGGILRVTERLSCGSAGRVIAVSKSLAALAIAEGVVSPDKLMVVRSGSSNGVDIDRFHPPSQQARSAARQKWGLTSDDLALVFIGRLSPDKGLALLQEAVEGLASPVNQRVVLLLVGPDEGAGSSSFVNAAVDVRRLGYTDDIPGLLHACDLLVLPTQREGFPNVVLEAAASGLPVVTTDATGAVDSVADGVTGFVVPKDDPAALAAALERLATDPSLRRAMGAHARRRVEHDFANLLVWQGMLDAYLGTTSGAHRSRSSGAGSR